MQQVEDFRVVQTINVCTIFFISGLTLKTADIMAAVKAYVGFIYGLIAILIITPCIGFAMNEIPFSTKEFNVGLIVFASVPTTLTSGVTLVGQARGNTALALMMTVTSNMLGIVTTPYAVSLLLSAGVEVKLDSIQLLVKLVLTILVPMMVGKTLRELSSHLQTFATSHKVMLGLINNGSLICVVWQTLSRSQSKLIKQDPIDILQVIAAGIGMHLVYLIWNFGAVTLLRIDQKERKAVLILASQKTLPVSVTVISFLSEKVGDLGLVTIPCIVGHISQLFIDAYIVSRWASMVEMDEVTVNAISEKASSRNTTVLMEENLENKA